MTPIQIAIAVTKLTSDAIVSVLKKVDEDGFQGSDFLAPLSDPQFQEDFKQVIEDLLKKNQPTTPAA